MSVAEQKLVENINQWDAWARQFPEMRDEAAFANMVRTDPQRHQQFMQARQQRDAAEQRFHELQAVRAAGEMQIAARTAVANQAHVKAWADQQDKIFQNELAKRHPTYSKGEGLAKLQAAAKTYMKTDMGLSQAAIDAQWSGGGAIRSAAGQIAIMDAVAFKLAREATSPQALAAKRVHAPQPQVPSVYRPVSGADALDDVRRLERALANANGNSSLKLATQLQQAKRRAGLSETF
jgi:hypothetical protein